MTQQKDPRPKLEMLINACNEKLDEANLTETNTDYFLRYTVILPAGESLLHDDFSQDCECQPTVSRDDGTGWRTFNHNRILKAEQIATDDSILADFFSALRRAGVNTSELDRDQVAKLDQYVNADVSETQEPTTFEKIKELSEKIEAELGEKFPDEVRAIKLMKALRMPLDRVYEPIPLDLPTPVGDVEDLSPDGGRIGYRETSVIEEKFEMNPEIFERLLRRALGETRTNAEIDSQSGEVSFRHIIESRSEKRREEDAERAVRARLNEARENQKLGHGEKSPPVEELCPICGVWLRWGVHARHCSSSENVCQTCGADLSTQLDHNPGCEWFENLAAEEEEGASDDSTVH